MESNKKSAAKNRHKKSTDEAACNADQRRQEHSTKECVDDCQPLNCSCKDDSSCRGTSTSTNNAAVNVDGCSKDYAGKLRVVLGADPADIIIETAERVLQYLDKRRDRLDSSKDAKNKCFCWKSDFESSSPSVEIIKSRSIIVLSSSTQVNHKRNKHDNEVKNKPIKNNSFRKEERKNYQTSDTEYNAVDDKNKKIKNKHSFRKEERQNYQTSDTEYNAGPSKQSSYNFPKESSHRNFIPKAESNYYPATDDSKKDLCEQACIGWSDEQHKCNKEWCNECHKDEDSPTSSKKYNDGVSHTKVFHHETIIKEDPFCVNRLCANSSSECKKLSNKPVQPPSYTYNNMVKNQLTSDVCKRYCVNKTSKAQKDSNKHIGINLLQHWLQHSKEDLRSHTKQSAHDPHTSDKERYYSRLAPNDSERYSNKNLFRKKSSHSPFDRDRSMYANPRHDYSKKNLERDKSKHSNLRNDDNVDKHSLYNYNFSKHDLDKPRQPDMHQSHHSTPQQPEVYHSNSNMNIDKNSKPHNFSKKHSHQRDINEDKYKHSNKSSKKSFDKKKSSSYKVDESGATSKNESSHNKDSSGSTTTNLKRDGSKSSTSLHKRKCKPCKECASNKPCQINERRGKRCGRIVQTRGYCLRKNKRCRCDPCRCVKLFGCKHTEKVPTPAITPSIRSILSDISKETKVSSYKESNTSINPPEESIHIPTPEESIIEKVSSPIVIKTSSPVMLKSCIKYDGANTMVSAKSCPCTRKKRSRKCCSSMIEKNGEDGSYDFDCREDGCVSSCRPESPKKFSCVSFEKPKAKKRIQKKRECSGSKCSKVESDSEEFVCMVDLECKCKGDVTSSQYSCKKSILTPEIKKRLRATFKKFKEIYGIIKMVCDDYHLKSDKACNVSPCC